MLANKKITQTDHCSFSDNTILIVISRRVCYLAIHIEN